MNKIPIKEYNVISNGGWGKVISMEDAKKEHIKNIAAWEKATKEYYEKDRPLRILVIHGSGRADIYGSSDDQPNQGSVSSAFLNRCMKVVDKIDKTIEVEEVNLTKLNINPCWNCVAVTSGLCGAPCDCHPVDDMHQLYPKLIRNDIHFISTGVNQSAMSSRLKLMVDRMISLDGGFFHDEDQFGTKDQAFITKMKLLAESGQIAYDQRLYGRVGGYFISSKDQNQPRVPTNAMGENSDKDIEKLGYARLVAYSLKDGMIAYGYFHDPEYWAVAAADYDIDYMYDMETMENNKKAHEKGERVIRNAIKLAKQLKKDLPEFVPDRINRT